MTYDEAYDLYDRKYARKVARKQNVIIKTWNKAEKGGATKKDWAKYRKAQDKIIQYENEIVEKAEKLSGEKAS